MTPSIKETVERLKDRVLPQRNEETDELTWVPDQDCQDAAAIIERLAGALEWYGENAGSYDADIDCGERARAALSGEPT